MFSEEITHETVMMSLRNIKKNHATYMRNGNQECAIISSINSLLLCDGVFLELQKMKKTDLNNNTFPGYLSL